MADQRRTFCAVRTKPNEAEATSGRDNVRRLPMKTEVGALVRRVLVQHDLYRPTIPPASDNRYRAILRHEAAKIGLGSGEPQGWADVIPFPGNHRSKPDDR